MSEFSITSTDFKEGEEIPKKFGYKFENLTPNIIFRNIPDNAQSFALIMDDPDAMAAVGKIWVHWLVSDKLATSTDNLYEQVAIGSEGSLTLGKTDFGKIGYGGPAPPNGRHTYIFKGYALDVKLGLKEGYSKQELENVMKGHILAEAKLTGTFTP